MLAILTDVILPVYMIAALGIILGRYKEINIQSISAIVFYLFSPALIFRSLSQSTMDNEIAIKVIMATWGIFIAGLFFANLWNFIQIITYRFIEIKKE